MVFSIHAKASITLHFFKQITRQWTILIIRNKLHHTQRKFEDIIGTFYTHILYVSLVCWYIHIFHHIGGVFSENLIYVQFLLNFRRKWDGLERFFFVTKTSRSAISSQIVKIRFFSNYVTVLHENLISANWQHGQDMMIRDKFPL